MIQTKMGETGNRAYFIRKVFAGAPTSDNWLWDSCRAKEAFLLDLLRSGVVLLNIYAVFARIKE